MPRPRVHDAALRDRLLEDASRVVADAGPDALSLRTLAAGAGTSTTAVYSLFGGREELLAAVVAEAFRRFSAHLADAPHSGEPAADLAGLARAYRRSALDDPHFYRVMFGPHRAGFEDQQVGPTFGTLVAAVQRCLDAEVLAERVGDATTVARTLWALVHGLVSLELGGLVPGDEAKRAATFDRGLSDIWLGLGRP
jgi:AcrR family transcriptional regulator